MDFRKYIDLHDRTEIYKANAIKAIIDLRELNLDVASNKDSYLVQSSDTELKYVIYDCYGWVGYNGTMPIEVLNLYLDGHIDEARAKFKGSTHDA